MNTLQSSYRAVIEHITADIETLKQNGQATDAALQKHCDLLLRRMNALNDRRDLAISGFRKQLETYLFLCENFWKEQHGKIYETRMDELLIIKKQVVKIHSLTGFDACYALLLAIKPLRTILPPRQFVEHAAALAALEKIKADCQKQLATYIKI
jgi:hypothetical protein